MLHYFTTRAYIYFFKIYFLSFYPTPANFSDLCFKLVLLSTLSVSCPCHTVSKALACRRFTNEVAQP